MDRQMDPNHKPIPACCPAAQVRVHLHAGLPLLVAVLLELATLHVFPACALLGISPTCRVALETVALAMCCLSGIAAAVAGPHGAVAAGPHSDAALAAPCMAVAAVGPRFVGPHCGAFCPLRRAVAGVQNSHFLQLAHSND